LTSINIKIGDVSSCYVGDGEDEDSMYLNTALDNNGDYQPYNNRYPIYYKTPDDVEGGFYNVSMQILNEEDGALLDSTPYVGNGLARMYPERDSYADGYDSEDYYGIITRMVESNFLANTAGTVFSMVLFPTIHKLSHESGSPAGGQVLTIKGTGFTVDTERLTVYVAGEECDILSSDPNKIVCRTKAHYSYYADGRVKTSIDESLIPSAFDEADQYIDDSKRNLGSPGWWAMLCQYNAGECTESNYYESFGLRRALNFGYWAEHGASNWNW
jgi:hypothetical protein